SGPTVGAWVWERGGPYYGVPLQNSLGWIVTTFTVYLLYRAVERRWTLQPVEPLSLPVMAAGPGLAHAAMKAWSPVPAQHHDPFVVLGCTASRAWSDAWQEG
ncbi:MAG: carotenoid biosynthesis protein, partial [Devosia sp.]|nr:carotenoid biosynthesis protein [Devosia sp.]